MLFTDDRVEWDPDLLSDARVTHFWDSDRDVGRWFDEHEAEIGFTYNKGPVVWDSYFLFGPDATWADVPRPLVSYGNTVFAEKDLLLDAMREVLES